MKTVEVKFGYWEEGVAQRQHSHYAMRETRQMTAAEINDYLAENMQYLDEGVPGRYYFSKGKDKWMIEFEVPKQAESRG